MFNKDTDLIFEAYRTHTVEEGKMKDIATAIEMGDDVDEIIKDLKLDDTEEIRNYITKERDDFYEKGERADAIAADAFLNVSNLQRDIEIAKQNPTLKGEKQQKVLDKLEQNLKDITKSLLDFDKTLSIIKGNE